MFVLLFPDGAGVFCPCVLPVVKSLRLKMNGFQTVVYSTLIRYADGDYKNCMFLSDGSGSPIQELDHNGTFLRKEKQSSKLNYISVTGGCHKHELEINFS